jgi:hypothetical protein
VVNLIEYERERDAAKLANRIWAPEFLATTPFHDIDSDVPHD